MAIYGHIENSFHLYPNFSGILNKHCNPYANAEIEYSIKSSVAEYEKRLPTGSTVNVTSINILNGVVDVKLEVVLPHDGIIYGPPYDNSPIKNWLQPYEECLSADDEEYSVATIGVDYGIGDSCSTKTFICPSGVTCKACNDFNEYCTTPSEPDGTHLCYKCRKGL